MQIFYRWLGLMLVFCPLICANATKNTTDAGMAIKHEIVCIHMIKGLHLSETQKHELINKNRQAESIKKNYDKKMYDHEMAMVPVLETLKTAVMDGDVEKDLKRKVHIEQRKWHQLRDEKSQELNTIVQDIENMLTENQKQVIIDYRPCFIPPFQAAIGQSAETEIQCLVHKIENLRYMAASMFEDEKSGFIETYLTRIKRHRKSVSDAEIESLRQEAEQILEKAHELPEKEFLIQKADLAQQLHIHMQSKRPKDLKTRIQKFLLDPVVVEYLSY